MIYQGGDEAAQASGEADEIDRRSVYVGNVSLRESADTVKLRIY